MDSPKFVNDPFGPQIPPFEGTTQFIFDSHQKYFLFFFLIIIFMVSIDLTDEGRNNPKEARHRIPLL